MTIWYSGNGWGWCSIFVHSPAMVILWGVVLTAMVLAVGFAIRQRNDPLAPTGTGSVRPEGAVAARTTRGETDNDEYSHRLM